jgi:mycothiol synthase
VVAAVQHLIETVKQYDAVEPVSEAPRLALLAGEPQTTHLLAYQEGALVGYAQVDGAGNAAELAVAPLVNRPELTIILMRRLLNGAPQARIWAHGDLPVYRAAAQQLGLVAVRELWEMGANRCSYGRVIPDPPLPLPAPWQVRVFDPVHDAAAWVELNAITFRDHPEQGELTLSDLNQRMEQPWFDPAGLLLLDRSDPSAPVAAPAAASDRNWDLPPNQLAGYVWTKIENGIGEIYGIGLRPVVQGQGLGSRLLERGLTHLESQGVREIRLFVEADNAPAIAVYRRQGFKVTRRDVQYAKPVADFQTF